MVAAMIGLPMCVATADDMEGQEGKDATPIPMVKVTIKKKEIEAVTTNVGDRYNVSKETIITNMDGDQVSIRKFLVPCDVEMTYQTINGKRVAERIKTVRLGSDASWKWEAAKPE